MTGLRNRKGWLTAEALKAGELEQWAIDGPLGRVVVQLEHVAEPPDPAELRMPWMTSVTMPDGSYATWRAFRLNVARKTFTELKNRHSQS